MPLTPAAMIRLLKKNGFVRIKSNNGSHQKLFNAKTQTTVIVPLHAKELSRPLRPGSTAPGGTPVPHGRPLRPARL